MGFNPYGGAGYGGGMNANNIVGQTNQYMNQGTQYALASGQVSQQNALQQAAVGYQMTIAEAEGIDAQLAMQQIATQYNILTDLESLGTKNVMAFASKALETYTLMAQYRTKTFQMFSEIADTRSQSSWASMKKMVQGFKF